MVLEMLSTNEGGRTGAVRSGYRGLARFDGTDLDFGCELVFNGPPLAPGASGTGRLSMWAGEALPQLTVGLKFELREGTRVVARGTILDPSAGGE